MPHCVCGPALALLKGVCAAGTGVWRGCERGSQRRRAARILGPFRWHASWHLSRMAVKQSLHLLPHCSEVVCLLGVPALLDRCIFGWHS